MIKKSFLHHATTKKVFSFTLHMKCLCHTEEITFGRSALTFQLFCTCSQMYYCSINTFNGQSHVNVFQSHREASQMTRSQFDQNSNKQQSEHEQILLQQKKTLN